MNFTSNWPVGSSSSRHMRTIITRWTGHWALGPPVGRLLFSAVIDDSYIHFAKVWIDSLEHFGYETGDILLLCVSKSCSEWCEAHSYFCMFRFNAACTTKRCHVSSLKISGISTLLEYGYALFFFDLDVFLKKDPLVDVPVDGSHALISMLDRPPPNQHANFGLFLVRPNNHTIAMFRWMDKQFEATSEWDQGLYNNYISANGVAVAAFNSEKYVNFEVTSWDTGQVAAVHMVCIEGSYTKYFLARTVYGGFVNEDFYSGANRSTVTASFNEVANQSLETKAAWINVLANISRHTSRWIRIIDAPPTDAAHPTPLVPITFSADRLAKIGVQMVEAGFWESVAMFRHGYVATRRQLVIHSTDALSKESLGAIAEDDLQVTINLDALRDDPWMRGASPLGSSFLCKYAHENKGKAWCLVTCDGVHFR